MRTISLLHSRRARMTSNGSRQETVGDNYSRASNKQNPGQAALEKCLEVVVLAKMRRPSRMWHRATPVLQQASRQALLVAAARVARVPVAARMRDNVLALGRHP